MASRSKRCLMFSNPRGLEFAFPLLCFRSPPVVAGPPTCPCLHRAQQPTRQCADEASKEGRRQIDEEEETTSTRSRDAAEVSNLVRHTLTDIFCSRLQHTLLVCCVG